MLESPGTLATSATAVDIIVTWEPPFSLNLTTAEPDIAYCVDVYNTTNGGFDHLTSDCTVISSNYTFTVNDDPDPKDKFQFIITPRSNVEGARNGTSNNATAGFPIQSKWLLEHNSNVFAVHVSSVVVYV